MAWERKITELLLGHADLSIVLSDFGRADAIRFSPRRIEVVPNGIPDTCADFEKSVLPARQRRLRERTEGRQRTFSVLFLGACSAAKGLFASLDAIALVNRCLVEKGTSIVVQLIVAGEFCGDELKLPDDRRREASEVLERAERLLDRAVERQTFTPAAQKDLTARLRRRNGRRMTGANPESDERI